MRRFRLVAASALMAVLLIFIYGLNPWFRPHLRVKRLPRPNPTRFVFEASTDQIRAALTSKVVCCCGRAIEFRQDALFSGSILKSPGNENDAYLHNFHEPIGPSPVYLAGDQPLPYICEFHLHLMARSSKETEVVVIPHKSEVIEGESWWGLHGSSAYTYSSVAPTSIEEYKILLDLGSALGATNMPPVVLP
jgi:hypothetical protein